MCSLLLLSPPSSDHFQKVILVSEVPSRPGQPFIVGWRAYILSRVTLTFRLHQPNTQSQDQLPTSLEFSLFNFLRCVHISFTQKGDLYRMLQEEQEERHKIKDKQHSHCEKYCHFQRPPIGNPLSPLDSLSSCFFPGHPVFSWPLTKSQTL